MKGLRVGIYSGTFNPIHGGHVTFALQALEAASLDVIYFMPERRPRFKQNVEHYGHRVAMIRQALQLHPRLKVFETDDVSFTVRRTLPRIRQRFAGAELVFLMGSDMLGELHGWPNVDRLLRTSELVVGKRAEIPAERLSQQLARLPITYEKVHIIESFAPHVSSSEVRCGLRERRHVQGLLASVAHYSNRNWLYISLT